MSNVEYVEKLKSLAKTEPKKYIACFYEMDKDTFYSLSHEELRELLGLLIECYKSLEGPTFDTQFWDKIEKHHRDFFDGEELFEILDRKSVEYNEGLIEGHNVMEENGFLDLDDLMEDSSSLTQ